jgi:hypothetical protein
MTNINHTIQYSAACNSQKSIFCGQDRSSHIFDYSSQMALDHYTEIHFTEIFSRHLTETTFDRTPFDRMPFDRKYI